MARLVRIGAGLEKQGPVRCPSVMAGRVPAMTEGQRTGHQILLQPSPYPDTHGDAPGHDDRETTMPGSP
ncbi:hypothetical protein CCS01_24230 [Rhodopila globiformis]|uniref:Uncharacterized protein n=1 Tax=Rhodopila globiformis TaxID=1071 RepID=A0A2S6N1H5_RHOGL|nr:hypothetical protein CCS01_24230 [Rhodopila globiformis]